MQTFQCKICKLEYGDADLAKQCEDWCSAHNSCNFMIARQAINKDQAKNLEPEDDERFKS